MPGKTAASAGALGAARRVSTVMAMNTSDLVTHHFADDGRIPNNPVLPLVIYRAGIHLAGTPYPEDLIEKKFVANGWGDVWRNDAVYAYPHYHSTIHEVMAVARGRTIVRFGGTMGCEIDIGPGDVVMLPAGTGHQGVFASPGLVVVGAYPPNGTYNLRRASKAERAKAIIEIADVPPPETDPVFGVQGPLMELWRPQAAITA
jgi:uncharacterized protein YjlB